MGITLHKMTQDKKIILKNLKSETKKYIFIDFCINFQNKVQ